MEKLRLEETVYNMQPDNINKQGSLKTDAAIRDKEQTTTPTKVQYIEGRNSEFVND